MNLQRKLTLGYLGLILLVVSSSFFIYFSLGKNILVQFYLQEKLIQAQALAGAIDGDRHLSFTGPQALDDPVYQGYLKNLREFKTKNLGITSLYTVAQGKDKSFLYVLDADKKNRIHTEPESSALVYTQIFHEGIDRYFPEPQQTPYGTYFKVTAVIKNSQGLPSGILIMDVRETEVGNFQFQFLWMASYGVLPAFLLTLVLSILLSRHLVHPIGQFSRAAKKIQTGDFSIRIHHRRKDEYHELARAFNDMCTDLARSHRALETRAQEMDYLATHDGVTGLENRRAYFHKLDQLISFLERLKNPVTVAVMFLDLDKFKEVNDSLGHAAGDELLIKVGERLKLAVRTTDSVFRLGGDEFTLIISPLGQTQDASVVASKILEALRNPFDLKGHSVPIGVSIGVAFYPLDGTNASILTLNADTALYEAKRLGFSPVFYSPAMTDKVKKSARIREDLVHAFVQKEFRLVYQPIVDSQGSLVSAEALMRWDRPGYGPVSPMEFIPILEESSQISQAGLWAIKAVAKQIKLWESMELPSVPIGINLSLRQLKDREFRVNFLDTLFNPGFPREGIYFEITETMLAHESDVRALILSYAEKGMRFALDDFGTGYSSLASLSGLPFTYLKIDKHFVDLIPENKKTVSIVQAIIQLSKALNAITVAEGVETREQFEILKSLGCQRFQGYYFSKPVEPQEFHKDYKKTGY
ncbi:MAG: hypothetical protein A2Z96_01005 [Spirochaetes bacterium GWB1_48_6]|nr:MAG: hypothetical protein A2Z96_01005 [Spirochaetes bacterium GWB1_48_6]